MKVPKRITLGNRTIANDRSLIGQLNGTYPSCQSTDVSLSEDHEVTSKNDGMEVEFNMNGKPMNKQASTDTSENGSGLQMFSDMSFVSSLSGVSSTKELNN